VYCSDAAFRHIDAAPPYDTTEPRHGIHLASDNKDKPESQSLAQDHKLDPRVNLFDPEAPTRALIAPLYPSIVVLYMHDVEDSLLNENVPDAEVASSGVIL
jgi:hypothetical protein